jgi:hypothetical protein
MNKDLTRVKCRYNIDSVGHSSLNNCKLELMKKKVSSYNQVLWDEETS